MITNMRHKLVLSLYATIGLAGLVAAILGLGGTFVSLWFILAAASGADFGTNFDFGFALMLLGGWSVVAAVGVPVGFFGLRTWYRRRKAGPSPDEDAVAKTPVGRVLAVIIFGGFALYAGYTLVYAFPYFGREALLSLTGTTTLATVTDYVPAPEVSPNVVRVHYRLTTARGEVIEDSRNQWIGEIEEIKKTGTVPVTYLPHYPDIRVMNLKFDAGDIGKLLGQYIAILAVGVWGAGKNLGLWWNKKSTPGGSEPTQMPRGGAPITPAVRAAAATLPRTTFGRRGV